MAKRVAGTMPSASISLLIAPDALIIDAVRLSQMALPQRVFNFADAISLSVAAASIVAKTARDALMGQMDATYPGYSFAAHKGYSTAAASLNVSLSKLPSAINESIWIVVLLLLLTPSFT